VHQLGALQLLALVSARKRVSGSMHPGQARLTILDQRQGFLCFIDDRAHSGMVCE